MDVQLSIEATPNDSKKHQLSQPKRVRKMTTISGTETFAEALVNGLASIRPAEDVAMLVDAVDHVEVAVVKVAMEVAEIREVGVVIEVGATSVEEAPSAPVTSLVAFGTTDGEVERLSALVGKIHGMMGAIREALLALPLSSIVMLMVRELAFPLIWISISAGLGPVVALVNGAYSSVAFRFDRRNGTLILLWLL
jgi:hypothetical protein